MKILWVTYAPLGRAGELIENVKSQSGTWIDATAKSLLKYPNIKLCVASIASKNIKISDEKTNIDYYGIADVKRVIGEKPDKADTLVWEKIIQDIVPDLIMVWGTEYANGLSVVEAVKDIPVLFFIQGVIGRISQYPLGGLKKKEIINTIGFFQATKFLHFVHNISRFRRQKSIEIEMIEKSSGIITDNEWADSYYKAVIPDVKTYHFPLPINQIFLNGKYDLSKAKEHTIFTIDGCNPAKGMFHLIKAISIVKKIYPDVKLLIPGRIPTRQPRLIFESPYYTYLKKLIKKYALEQNVFFLGQQSSEQMREHLLSCNVFVMPSAIENHSSSLREAMYLGVPCVSSLVGSVDEFTQYKENILTYRYEEEDALAVNIIKIFSDKNLAKCMGECGYRVIREIYPQTDLGQKLECLYQEVIKGECVC